MRIANFFPLIFLLALSLPTHAQNKVYRLSNVPRSVDAADFKADGDGWSVVKQTLHGGRSEGVEMVTIDNGVLQIAVLPTRGMSVYEVKKGNLRLGWDSPLPEITHPNLVDLESRGGLGWLEGFNEWMVRCGLEFAGHPGEDEIITNTGGTNTQTLTLHGKIGNIPASEVSLLVKDGWLRLRGTVYEKFFYGPKLKLQTELATKIGGDTFQINDRVTNLGASEQEFQIIYHGNYGSSILEAGATVHTAANQVQPMNDHAAESLTTWATYAGPTTGFVEEVYLVEPRADAEGNCLAVLRNKAGNLATSVQWNHTQLPYLTVWKNTAAKEDGYVTGIEPATGYPFNRKVERKFGRVPALKPQQSREFSLQFGIHEGAEAVKAALGQVDAIQGSHPPRLIHEPPQP